MRRARRATVARMQAHVLYRTRCRGRSRGRGEVVAEVVHCAVVVAAIERWQPSTFLQTERHRIVAARGRNRLSWWAPPRKAVCLR